MKQWQSAGFLGTMKNAGSRTWPLALAAVLALLVTDDGLAQQPKAPTKTPSTKAPSKGAATAAGNMADIFSQVGDQIYEDCIFELSEEQLEVQHALIQAYIKQGATSALARQLAVKQIQPPKLSDKMRADPEHPPSASPWATTTTSRRLEKKPLQPRPAPKCRRPRCPSGRDPIVALANKKALPQWDCAPNVDFVTIKLNGYQRKLTGGEICNPFEDVVREVPAAVGNFRLGYTIKTGRLFVISDNPQVERQDDRLGHLRPRRLPQQPRSRLLRCPRHRPAAAWRIFVLPPTRSSE